MEKNKVTHTAPSFIAIGGSAGSLHVILKLVQKLQPTFTVPILIVIHRDPFGESRLKEIISFRTRLAVEEIEDKDLVQPGHIYICPPDYHVLLENDKSFSLDYSEKEYFSRPSINVAFRSLADVYGNSLA